MANKAIDEELIEELCEWVDKIPLSRPKKDMRRDFSDGVMVAEVVKHYFPNKVEIHNYAPTNNINGKTTNWKLLNRKVFKKLEFEVGDDVIENIVHCKPWAVEQFLMVLRGKIDRMLYEGQRKKGKVQTADFSDDQPEVDQNYKSVSPVMEPRRGGRGAQVGGRRNTGNHGLGKTNSLQDLNAQAHGSKTSPPKTQSQRGDMVSKVVVEEKEQELLAKEETIQILNAKVRRLEHLLHLKNIRIDDLQGRLDRMTSQLRPTANYNR